MRFAYEWRDDSGNWFRSYGNDNWKFYQRGLTMGMPLSTTYQFERKTDNTTGRCDAGQTTIPILVASEFR